MRASRLKTRVKIATDMIGWMSTHTTPSTACL